VSFCLAKQDINVEVLFRLKNPSYRHEMQRHELCGHSVYALVIFATVDAKHKQQFKTT